MVVGYGHLRHLHLILLIPSVLHWPFTALGAWPDKPLLRASVDLASTETVEERRWRRLETGRITSRRAVARTSRWGVPQQSDQASGSADSGQQASGNSDRSGAEAAPPATDHSAANGASDGGGTSNGANGAAQDSGSGANGGASASDSGGNAGGSASADLGDTAAMIADGGEAVMGDAANMASSVFGLVDAAAHDAEVAINDVAGLADQSLATADGLASQGVETADGLIDGIVSSVHGVTDTGLDALGALTSNGVEGLIADPLGRRRALSARPEARSAVRQVD
jgi:hypothetical protein